MSNFYTDVLKKDKRFHDPEPINDLAMLEPITRRKVVAIIADAKAHGVVLHVQETFRSQELQEKYFRQGNTQLRHVGVHGYGLAADIVPLDRHGNPTWDTNAYGHAFDLIYHLAVAHELVSGVDWGRPGVRHSFIDRPHLQRVSVADQAKLFAGTWYPDPSYVAGKGG